MTRLLVAVLSAAVLSATTFAAAYGCLTNTVVATLGMAVVDGVTIHVADGTYAERGFTLKGAIRVVGSSGVRENVRIGKAGGRVFYLDNAGAALDSITIQYGDCLYGDGAQVGAYARIYLAELCARKGDEAEAEKLRAEIPKLFPDALTHRGGKMSDFLGK